MPSSELATTFENASQTISLRLKTIPGVGTVLNAIKTKVLSGTTDPLVDRSLIIEPSLFSQIIDVPRGTVEAVLEELRRFNFVHIWVRAVCPAVDDDDDNVIVETDDPTVFKSVIKESCPHCGGYHEEVSWQTIETFFAIHVDGEDDPFKMSRFFIPRKKLEPPRDLGGGGVEPVLNCRRLIKWGTRFFVQRAGTPAGNVVTEVSEQLALNQPNASVPEHTVLAWRLVCFICGWSGVTILAFLVCRWWGDIATTLVVTSTLIIAGVCAVLVLLKLVFAVPFAVRGFIGSGYFLGFALIGVSVDLKITGGEKDPLKFSAVSSKPDAVLAVLAVVAYAISTFGVLAHLAISGWFSRKT